MTQLSYLNLNPITVSSESLSNLNYNPTAQVNAIPLKTSSNAVSPDNIFSSSEMVLSLTNTIKQISEMLNQTNTILPGEKYNAITQSTTTPFSSSLQTSTISSTTSQMALSTSESNLNAIESTTKVIPTLMKSSSTAGIASPSTENAEIESSTPLDLIQKDREIVSQMMRKLSMFR